MPYVAQVASGKLKKINVFGNDYPTPDGTGVRDYIHVVDLARGHIAAIEGCGEAGVHVYNLGTGVGYSVLDMIRAFEKACGKKLPYEIGPRRAGDIAACYADCSKAEKELGWKAEYGIERCAATSGTGRAKTRTDTAADRAGRGRAPVSVPRRAVCPPRLRYNTIYVCGGLLSSRRRERREKIPRAFRAGRRTRL